MNAPKSKLQHALALTCAGVLVLAAAACGGDDDDDAMNTTSALPSATEPSDSDPPAAEGSTPTTGVPSDVSGTSDPTAETAATSEEMGEPYSVVFIADSTGAFATSGSNGVAGFSAAIDAINQSGGVDGHPIEFDVLDSQTTPTGIQAAGLQAVESEPIAIAGCLLSSQVPALVNTIGGANIPTVIGCSNNEDLVNPVIPWYFQVSADSPIYAEAFARSAASLVGGSLEGSRIGFVGLTSAGVDGILVAAEEAVEAEGGEVVRTERTDITIASFDAQAANMVAAEPDVVYIVDQSASSVLIGKALRTAGYAGSIILADGSASDLVMSQIGGDGVYGQRFVIPPVEGSPAYAATEAAGALESMQDQAFSKSWVSAHVIAAGLKACGFPCEPSALIEAIDTMGPIDIADVTTGPVDFTADNHVGVNSVALYAWDPSANVSTAEDTFVFEAA